MKKEFLEKNGTFIVEYDIKDSFYHGYAGSRKIYLYDNCLYEVVEYNNQFTYMGRNCTYLLIGDVKKYLEERNNLFWRNLGIYEDALQFLKANF